jgi:WD40 repeat protein
MMKLSSSVLAFFMLAANAYAVDTRFWQQTDASDFEKGTLNQLSLRSDGRLFLAPQFREVFDPSTPYLWALAADAKGNLYAGGGGTSEGTAKLFVVDAQGKGRTLAELDGLEIHAIALDKTGNVFAATDPDGKVYKVTPQGKSQLFFDPKEKYIWALAFNSQGDLFAATGDQGKIYRVNPAGQGSVFFKTEETHARSLVIDSHDNLIVGTEPGGLILRVSAEGKGFVLYQTPKREVTAVAVGKAGEIYAAAVGTRSATPVAASTPPQPQPAASPITPQAAHTANPPGSLATPIAPISGGSEVYRIEADDSPHKVWSNNQDIVYAIAMDSAGRPLLATGNRGNIYRLDTPLLASLLIPGSPTQITDFAIAPSGAIYAATGNIGRIYEIGPAAAPKGFFESDVLDAGSFTYWGRLSFRGSPRDVSIVTRSGNLNHPDDNWSPWAPLRIEQDSAAVPCTRCLNGRVASPSARFLQYKVELSASTQGVTPEISSVEIAYVAKNVAPMIDEVEITPANYKFPTPTPPLTATNSITLQPLGQKKRSNTGINLDLSGSQTLSYAKGLMGARWSASDENGDSLIYTVEIRGVGETGWQLLKDKVREKYISFDSTAYPDGDYELRVTASDAPSNTPSEALTCSYVTEPFLIDNTPPRVLNLTAAPAGGKMEVRWKAADARSIIDHAEYSLNGGEWTIVDPTGKLSDAPEETYAVTLDRSGPGEQTIAVRVTDSYDNQCVEKVLVK